MVEEIEDVLVGDVESDVEDNEVTVGEIEIGEVGVLRSQPLVTWMGCE